MPRVRVTQTILIDATPSVTVLYPAGFEGLAPDDHIVRIVAAGAGERLTGRGDVSKAPPQEVSLAALPVDAPQ